MSNKLSKETRQKIVNGAIRSAEISKKRKQKRIEKYNLDPILCRNCDNPLNYSKRYNIFCGHSCAASFNNNGKVKNFTTGKWAKKECKFCGKITKNPKYCSFDCQKKFNWNKKEKEIEETGIIPAVNTGKKYLRKIRGNKCEICNLTKWREKDIVMILDHIDGNSEDNSLKNLRLICPNCDSQTSTYKGRNKGNGRHSRRKRYAEGKSY